MEQYLPQDKSVIYDSVLIGAQTITVFRDV